MDKCPSCGSEELKKHDRGTYVYFECRNCHFTWTNDE